MNLTARVAAYLEGIETARRNGESWRDIFERIASELDLATWQQLWEATKRARRAVATGRLAPDQKKLPPRPGEKQARQSPVAMDGEAPQIGLPPLPGGNRGSWGMDPELEEKLRKRGVTVK